MLGLKLQDKIPCSEIRKRTKITDIIEIITPKKIQTIQSAGGLFCR